MKNKFVIVAGVQSKVSSDLNKNLEHTTMQVEKAAKRGAQIICLQELFRTPYFPQYKKVTKDTYAESIPGISTEMFSKIAKKYGIVLIIPVYEKDSKGEYHNSAVVVDEKGKLLPVYHKIHIPHDPLFYEKNYFKQGDTG